MTYTDEQKALAADLMETYQAAFDEASEGQTNGLFISGDAGLLAVYNRGVAAQPGWREITRDEITPGMRVRVVKTRGDRINTYEGIADYEFSGDWCTPEGWWFFMGRDDIHVFTPCADGLPRELSAEEVYELPDGARFQAITTFQMRSPRELWRTVGDPTYRLLHLPEANPDPALIDLIGKDAARKIAEAGLIVEPKPQP